MSKKGPKLDDMFDQLVHDERLMEILITRLTERLTPIIKGIFDKYAEEFTSKLKGMVEGHAEEFISAHCESENQRTTALELENEQLRAHINEIENDQRLNNLIICGLAETPTEIPANDESTTASESIHSPSAQQTPVQSVVDFCNKSLHLNISEAEVSYAYRLKRKGKDKYPPLMVSFVSRHVRNRVYAARKILRDSSDSQDSAIYINEHLTKLNAQIFAEARKLVREKKAASTWTAGGRVFLRYSILPSEKPKRILSLKNLDDL